MPLSLRAWEGSPSDASEPEDLSIPAGRNPADPTTRPRERVDGKGDVPVARTAVLGFDAGDL